MILLIWIRIKTNPLGANEEPSQFDQGETTGECRCNGTCDAVGSRAGIELTFPRFDKLSTLLNKAPKPVTAAKNRLCEFFHKEVLLEFCGLGKSRALLPRNARSIWLSFPDSFLFWSLFLRRFLLHRRLAVISFLSMRNLPLKEPSSHGFRIP